MIIAEFGNEKDCEDFEQSIYQTIDNNGRISQKEVNDLLGRPSLLFQKSAGWTSRMNFSRKKIVTDNRGEPYIMVASDPQPFEKKKEKNKMNITDEMLDNVRLHADICDEIHDLYCRKNRDYGNAFHDTFVEEGFAMARIRLTDKLNRFKTLTKNPSKQQVNDESVRDTLIDLANYAIMTIMEIDRMNHEKSKQKEEPK